MNLEVKHKHDQPQFSRTEYICNLTFSGATPKRADIHNLVANQTKAKKELVIIKKISPVYGHESVGVRALVYKSDEVLKKLEPEFIIKKHTPAKKEGDDKTKEEPKKEAAPPTEEKKEEAPKAEEKKE